MVWCAVPPLHNVIPVALISNHILFVLHGAGNVVSKHICLLIITFLRSSYSQCDKAFRHTKASSMLYDEV